MLILVCVFQAYGPPAAYGSGTAGPMDGYGNETPYFPFGHPSRQAPSSGPPKRKKEVPLSGQTFFFESCSNHAFLLSQGGMAEHTTDGMDLVPQPWVSALV